MNLSYVCFALILFTGIFDSTIANAQTESKASEPPLLAAELEKFRPFINKTYRGEYVNNTTGKVSIDISQWARALNGQAIRILHSIDDGEYGGETLFFYDRQLSSLRFFYFTTANFYTEGSAHFEQGALISREKINGDASGITEVQSIINFKEDGNLHIDSTYMKGSEPLSTSTAIYKPIENRDPIFK